MGLLRNDQAHEKKIFLKQPPQWSGQWKIYFPDWHTVWSINLIKARSTKNIFNQLLVHHGCGLSRVQNTFLKLPPQWSGPFEIYFLRWPPWRFDPFEIYFLEWPQQRCGSFKIYLLPPIINNHDKLITKK